MLTSDLIIEELPAPQGCGVCGRPTTRYAPELGIAYCGREERPPGWERPSEFAPVMRGELGPRRRRLLRRLRLRR